jgi:hypothetical protein
MSDEMNVESGENVEGGEDDESGENVESGEKRGKKHGPDPGTRYKSKVSLNDWYYACQVFSEKEKRPIMKDFLRSDDAQKTRKDTTLHAYFSKK